MISFSLCSRNLINLILLVLIALCAPQSIATALRIALHDTQTLNLMGCGRTHFKDDSEAIVAILVEIQ